METKQKNATYIDYWGLEYPIFHEPPPHQNLYFPTALEDQLKRIVTLLGQTESSILISLPPGGGKSTLAKWIKAQIQEQDHLTVYIHTFQSSQTKGWLSSHLSPLILADGAPPLNLDCLASQVEQSTGRLQRLTLVIDDAHRLSLQSMEEIHGFVSQRHHFPFSFNIVLVGDTQIETTLEQIPALKNRLYHTQGTALTTQQISKYLDQILKFYKLPKSTIVPQAFMNIATISKGIFTLINQLLELSLIEAFLGGEKTIDSQVVSRAARLMNYASVTRDDSSIAPDLGPERLPQQADKPEGQVEKQQVESHISRLFYKKET